MIKIINIVLRHQLYGQFVGAGITVLFSLRLSFNKRHSLNVVSFQVDEFACIQNLIYRVNQDT